MPSTTARHQGRARNGPLDEQVDGVSIHGGTCRPSRPLPMVRFLYQGECRSCAHQARSSSSPCVRSSTHPSLSGSYQDAKVVSGADARRSREPDVAREAAIESRTCRVSRRISMPIHPPGVRNPGVQPPASMSPTALPCRPDRESNPFNIPASPDTLWESADRVYLQAVDDCCLRPGLTNERAEVSGDQFQPGSACVADDAAAHDRRVLDVESGGEASLRGQWHPDRCRCRRRAPRRRALRRPSQLKRRTTRRR